MPITLRGVGALATGTASPLTVNLPETASADDLILLFMAVDSTGAGSGTITATGYTERTWELNAAATPDTFYAVLSKFAVGGETSVSVSASAGASNGFFGFAAVFRGVDTTTPFDGVTPVDSQTATTEITFTPTGISTATANAWAISAVGTTANIAGGITSDTLQSSTLHASGSSYNTTTGSDSAFGLATREVASAGAVTQPTWKTADGTGKLWVGTAFCLRSGATSQTIAASTVSAAGSVPAPTVSAGSTVTASTVSGTATVPELEAEISVAVDVSTVSAVSTVGTVVTNPDSELGVATVSAVSTVGSVTITTASTTFSGPTDEYPFAGALHRWDWERGRTVYRLNGTWYETTDPLWSTIRDADLVPVADRPGGERTDGTDRDRYLFLGGRDYPISDAVAATLTAAGFGSYVEEA